MCSPDGSEKDDDEEEQTVSTHLTSLSVSFLTPAFGAELHSDILPWESSDVAATTDAWRKDSGS
jgi:hypothetical protein